VAVRGVVQVDPADHFCPFCSANVTSTSCPIAGRLEYSSDAGSVNDSPSFRVRVR